MTAPPTAVCLAAVVLVLTLAGRFEAKSGCQIASGLVAGHLWGWEVGMLVFVAAELVQ